MNAERPPRMRAECERGPRPCPWSACRHWLSGGQCTLDVADRVAKTGKAASHRELAELMKISCAGAQVIEQRALRKVRELLGLDGDTFDLRTGVFR